MSSPNLSVISNFLNRFKSSNLKSTVTDINSFVDPKTQASNTINELLPDQFVNEEIAGGFSLLAQEDPAEFSKLSQGIQDFLDWFKKLITCLYEKFNSENPNFNFEAKDAPSKFQDSIKKIMGTELKESFDKLIGFVKASWSYCQDEYIKSDNQFKQMLDATLDHKIIGETSLKKVLEFAGAIFR